MERGIFTSDIIEKFNACSKDLYDEKRLIVHLTRIKGARWEFVAGYREKEISFFVSTREMLSPEAGLLIYSERPLDDDLKESIIDEIKFFIDDPGFDGNAFKELGFDEIVHFLRAKHPDEIDRLYTMADEVRKEHVGDQVHIRGIVEASNICEKNCSYCGIRKDNNKVKRYKLTSEEIFDSAGFAHSLGYKTILIQTGEAKVYPVVEMCRLIEKIKRSFDMAVTLSLGELKREDYAGLKNAGADRYLLRFETSDRQLFAKLKPDGDLDARIARIRWLKQLGFQVGSGIMVGLPGQSFESIARDILFFKELNLDMVGSGPFIASENTPLAGAAGGDLTVSLKLIALTRLVTLNAHIPATTALGTIHPEGRQRGLKCGANVLMPNCTPRKYRKHYMLYPDKICIEEEPSDCSSCLKAMIRACGRKVGEGYGHSLKSA